MNTNKNNISELVDNTGPIQQATERLLNLGRKLQCKAETL